MSSPSALRSPSAFAALRRDGRRARRGTITVTWAPVDPAAPPRVAVSYAIGRRVGGAVVRNRIRRRLRAVVREISGDAGDGAAGAAGGLVPGAYLFAASPEAATIPYEELRRTVTEALRAVTSR